MSRQVVGACPGCGAEVSFHAGDTVLAVCDYCATACVRRGDGLRSVGKMAQLFDDHSPLRLGAHGAWEGRPFSLVGRLQYRYSQGTWNEWRILFEDGSPGWLSDDNGSYVISLDKGVVAAPSFDDITVGESLTFNDVGYTVAYREMATVIAGAGELPFIVGSGYDAPVVDLRSTTGQIATLDYSDMVTDADSSATIDEPSAAELTAQVSAQTAPKPPAPASQETEDTPAGPRLYLGVAAELSTLNIQGIAETSVRQVEIKPFSCPHCGATVTPQFTKSRTISCMSCASVMDLSQGVGSDIAFYRQDPPPKILLPIGSTGTFGSVKWT